MTFALGQRWISDTESDLGLGTVVALDARTVTLLFAASEENRVYARSDAPVTRVTFNVGDVIDSHEGWSLKVDQVVDDNGVLSYLGTRTDTEETGVLLREIMLSHQIRFNKPQDKLYAGQIDRMDNFVLRYRALNNQYQQHKSPMRGLCGMRAGLIPHQLYIAHEVGRRHAPRVLLADEVGLGKTIEAGMIIHQQVLSGRAERILIVVPETLQHQWLVEMMRRFNLHFSVFDEERCIEAYAEADNPFDTQQYVLCSLDFLRKSKKRFEQALDADWDLLVVDEAHHLEWSQDNPSREYQVVEGLAQRTAGVLLLTATPEQLGHESHFARLRLLDPDRFYDYEAFVKEEQQYAPVADAVATLFSGEKLENEAKNQITELLSEQDVEPLFRIIEGNCEEEEKAKARQELIDNLMDRHGTGRVLFRNTRAAIKGFPERNVHLLPMDIPSQYTTAMRVAGMLGGQMSAEARAMKMLYPEEIYQEFEGDSATWWQFDSRVNWLIEKVKAKRSEKVLVIASRANTALQLEQALREREGIRATVFHEGMSILERDKAAAYFAQDEGGAQVLICSEIGSEGRNFQFANQLVMFDLPFNPDLLEQRIGRLDRIGQQRDIDIYVPYLKGTSQAILARWFDEGLSAFGETCPTGRAVYDQYSEQLIEMLASGNTETLDEVIEHSRHMNQELKSKLEQGRDRLLEIHSNGGEKAQGIVEQIESTDGDTNLVTFALSLFDTIGLNQDDKGENALVVTPSEHMMVPSYPGLPYEGATITFDRDTALSREDMHFMSWEHPMIQGGIDLLLSEGVGTSAVSLLKNKALPVGTILLELVYLVDAQAPKRSGLSRFLPQTPIRMMLDGKGNDLSEQVEFEGFNRQLSPVNRHLASKLVNSVQNDVHKLIEAGEGHIQGHLEKVREGALKDMQSSLNGELERLQALKAVNPNIRDEELESIESQIKELTGYIQSAQIQLDSLRLIVVSHN
ncbi:RNA polymerase-associated protein rapA [Vibrio nigripulchritudo SFn27]|uniref:RNA polymerase-associated protein RapA n=1 Tax=Vibrio nigripulchritudo TaxID=28173 RepID=U4K8P8_9VIBR|nr:RNA polymerase-associated protein RapA [Vibrio nigripulchritudo]CCN84811.1 RNA polymerase-associated protein rapA [Vibrio nigripulchritudo BLFn1]CCN87696.1 RNA polymerase-associated protein rapA [Vibrio nigripulchritudo SFn27]CCN95808.1 RNA polymerase-associated protein rapA [Vibrio nigripulchritudo ENn2]CCO38966.1 RNA polymerase-associated protein rapA [Vibrio nigripulchritudo SFn135]CCO51925.1 RNA polymerase-associated protein rapA [Vibrio nigripulchritudo Wn13]